MTSARPQLISATLVMIGVIIGFSVWYGMVSSESAQVASLQQQITTESNTISRVAYAHEALTAVAASEKKVQNYFVSEADIVSFINTVEGYGKAQGATVKVLSVSTGGTKTQPLLTLSLTVTGSFDAVMRTAGAIEYMPYAAYVTTLTMNKTDKGSSSTTWRANVGLTVESVAATPQKTS